MLFGLPQRLTRLQAQFTSVAFSPDSRYIAFACIVRRHCAVFLLDRDSGTATRLAGQDNVLDDAYYNLQFSPNGTFLIAVAVEEDGALSHVTRIDIATRTRTRLTMVTHVGTPNLSLDGRHAVIEIWDNSIPDLFRVRVADGKLTRLTDTRAEPGFVDVSRGTERYSYRDAKHRPCYHSDGKSILYLSTFYDGKPNQPRQIFRIDPDGSNPTRLTAFTEGSIYQMLWHPDGKQVAFTLHHDLDEAHKHRRNLWKYRDNLYLVNTTGLERSPACQIENTNSVNHLGCFHPCGRYITYSSSREECYPEGWRNWDIQILDLETGDTMLLTDDDVYDTDPLFSPDGKTLLFVSERDNPRRNTDISKRSAPRGSDLYLVNLAEKMEEAL